MEIVKTLVRSKKIKCALFDFDGTLSLIREGWQNIMIPMMTELIMKEAVFLRILFLLVLLSLLFMKHLFLLHKKQLF